MGLINPNHKIFIDQMVLHGDSVKAYMAAFPGSSLEAAENNSYNLMIDETIWDKDQISLFSLLMTIHLLPWIKQRIYYGLKPCEIFMNYYGPRNKKVEWVVGEAEVCDAVILNG
jgi:hypothetical protein